MTYQLSGVVSRAAQVTVQDVVVAAARAYKSVIPCDRGDATVVSSQSPDQFVRDGVPYL
jgi:hypothetical protein